MKKITCEDAKALVMLSIYGETDRQEDAILENHTRLCPECAREHKDLKIMRSGLSRAPGADISKKLLSEIKTGCAAVISVKRAKLFSGRFFLKPAAALLVFAVIAAALIYFRPADKSTGIAELADKEYSFIDELLVEAENTSFMISLETAELSNF